jgi:hypothetical protein
MEGQTYADGRGYGPGWDGTMEMPRLAYSATSAKHVPEVATPYRA